MSHNGNNNAGNGNNLTIGDYANGMPNIRLSEIPRSFARQLPWMLLATLIMIGASWWFTKDIKREYVAGGRIMVKVGEEHTYNPDSGIKSSGINFTPDQITLTEVGIIKNDEIIDQVAHAMIDHPEFGRERFAPELWGKWNTARAEKRYDDANDYWNDIIKFVEKSYAVSPSPKSSNVDLAFKHEDGAVAVETLDTFMTTYLNFRNEIFVTEKSDLIGERRAATEDQLTEVDRKIQRILNRNGISEFDSEQKGAQKRTEEMRTQLNTLQAQLSAVEAALAATEDQLRATSPTIDLYIDDRAAARLAQAELEKGQLLAKYVPTSTAVRNKEAEISQLRAQINANGGKPSGGRRVGPNTVYQTSMTQRNTYQAQADSYREQEITLQRQLNAADAKVKRMRQLGPTYKNLVREKATLEETLKSINAKEQVALVNQQQEDTKADNITIINRPTMARKGRNMSKIMFVLASLASLFTIFMLALLRVFLDPKLYGSGPQARMGVAPVAPASELGEPIPEAVPEYEPADEPAHEPEPAYAPAAYEPTEYDPAAYAQPTSSYGQVAGTAHAQTGGHEAQAYYGGGDNGPQMYADGSYAAEAPTMSAPAVNYEAVAPVSTPQTIAPQMDASAVWEFAGPDSTIPVLAKIEPSTTDG